jgi:hypothetical protein
MRFVAAGAAAALLAAVPLVATSHSAGAADPQVAALRAATAKYHRLDATLASGRTDLHLCFDHMGEHFANPEKFGDGILDPLDPEAMVYAHDGDHLRLVAVEWVSTTPGEVMGMPLHFNPALNVWVMHMWIWDHNPDGMMADFNPTVGTCPAT